MVHRSRGESDQVVVSVRNHPNFGWVLGLLGAPSSEFGWVLGALGGPAPKIGWVLGGLGAPGSEICWLLGALVHPPSTQVHPGHPIGWIFRTLLLTI